MVNRGILKGLCYEDADKLFGRNLLAFAVYLFVKPLMKKIRKKKRHPLVETKVFIKPCAKPDTPHDAF